MRSNALRAAFILASSAVLAFGVLMTAQFVAGSSAHHRDGHVKGGKGKGKGQGKHKMYIFRGTYNAADGSVDVTGGNKRTKRAGLVGTTVQFDYSSAKFSVIDGPDANATGNEQADVQENDRVLVQAKLGNQDPGPQPFKAKRLNDLTNPPAPSPAPA